MARASLPRSRSHHSAAADPARAPESSSSGLAGKLVPLSVVALGLLTLWKVVQTCSITVHPKCVTVVYDTRRRTVLCTSADREMRKQGLPRVTHFSPLLYLSGMLIYRNTSLLVVPPSSFFGTFTLPKSVFSEPGESVDCLVENIQISDGAVDMVLTVSYMIPMEQLERYLAAVGPQPPNELIGLAAADVARVRCADLSVGVLISRSRRESIFMPAFREHLASKLMSEAAVQVTAIVAENVELLDDA